MKFVFVISKEKGFLYKVVSMHKTTDAFFNLLKNPRQALMSFSFLVWLPTCAPFGVLMC